jgi:transketolase
MPRITKKMLEEKIEQLEKINKLNISEINRLNSEIDCLKQDKNVISKEDYVTLVKELEHQELQTKQYKKLFDDLKKKHSSQRDVLLDRIKELEEQLKRAEIKKLNDRNAGRKAYSNEKVIQNIYSLYLEGNSLQAITNELNRSGIKTKRGKEWAKSSIRFILLNSKNVSNGFIDEDTFNSSVKLLNDNKKVKSD